MIAIKYMTPPGAVSIWSYSIISIAVSLIVGIPVSLVTKKAGEEPPEHTTIYG